MKSELLKAVNERKGRILPIALDIFNKVQQQKVPMFKISEDKTQKKVNECSKNIQGTLQRFDVLLNNPRSPVYSTL